MDDDFIRATRFSELGYTHVTRNLWRNVDISTGNVVGPHYRSKAELLADLERYAALFGCCAAHKHNEMSEGVGGNGNAIYLVNTICNLTGRWLHTERFTNKAEAESWLKFA